VADKDTILIGDDTLPLAAYKEYVATEYIIEDKLGIVKP
jgi:hypothetical protein